MDVFDINEQDTEELVKKKKNAKLFCLHVKAFSDYLFLSLKTKICLYISFSNNKSKGSILEPLIS